MGIVLIYLPSLFIVALFVLQSCILSSGLIYISQLAFKNKNIFDVQYIQNLNLVSEVHNISQDSCVT